MDHRIIVFRGAHYPTKHAKTGKYSSSCVCESTSDTIHIDDMLSTVLCLCVHSNWCFSRHINMGNCHAREDFYSAVQQGNMADMERLIHKVKDVNFVLKTTGSGPLHIACIMGNIDVVRFLLDHGADTDLPDAQGRRALYIASMSGQLAIVRLLMDRSAIIHTKSNDGLTAFYVSAWRGHLDIVKLLCEAGVDIHVKDKEGRAAWDAAYEWDHDDVVNYLVTLRRGRGENVEDPPPRPIKPRESDAADKVYVDVNDDDSDAEEEGWTSVNIDEANNVK